METVYIGLGGNVGDVEASMRSALKALDGHPAITLKAKSALYETPPWGDENQDWFLNACARLETTLAPQALLDVMKSIESDLKRVKTRHWGPRTIDLDILLFGDREISDDRLEVPHPRMMERGFVLLPLQDLAPDISVKDRPLPHWLGKLETSEIRRIKSSQEW